MEKDGSFQRWALYMILANNKAWPDRPSITGHVTKLCVCCCLLAVLLYETRDKEDI